MACGHWDRLIRLTDGKKGSGAVTKQKLVETLRIEEIAFHGSTHCTLLMTRYIDTTTVIKSSTLVIHRQDESVFITRTLGEIVRHHIRFQTRSQS